MQVVTREEIFFPGGCNTLEFSENRGVNSASSSQSDSSSDPGLKTSKKRSRNPKRCKRNIMKKAKVEGSCYIMSSGKVKSPWDFLGVNLWSRDFFGFAGSPRDFFGS